MSPGCAPRCCLLLLLRMVCTPRRTLSVSPHMCDTSKMEACVRQCSVASMMLCGVGGWGGGWIGDWVWGRTASRATTRLQDCPGSP